MAHQSGKAFDGKPYAGNPHVRFDEGEVAPATTPRRGSLLYKKLACAVFGALAGAALPSAAETVVNLEANAPHELTAAENVAGTRLVAAEGSVLVLTGAASGGTYAVNCAITAQAGVFVIDATGMTGVSDLRLSRNLGSGGKGSVTIRGVSRLTYGSASNPSRTYDTSWMAFAAIDTDLAFVDGEGAAYESASVTFVNGVLIRQKPNYAYEIADEALVIPAAAGALDDKIVDSVLKADTWDVFLMRPEALPAGTKIAVGAGRTMLFKPCALNPPSYSWGGSSLAPFVCDIELGAGAKIVSGDRNNVNEIKGDISGSGEVSLEYSSGLTLDGDLSFDGRVVLDWAEKVDTPGKNCIRFRSSSPGKATNPICIRRGDRPSDVYCEPEGFGTTPTTFTMGDFISSAGPERVTLHTSAQGTVSMQTLTGTLYIEGAGTVSIARLGKGAKVYVPSGAKLVVGEKSLSSSIFLTKGPDGSCDWAIAGPASGAAVETSLQYPDDLTACTLTLGGALTLYGQLPAGCRPLTVETNAQVRVVADPSKPLTVLNQGGTLSLLDSGGGWRGKVGLWVDAADESTVTLAKDFTHIKGDRATAFAGQEDLAGAWADCRDPQGACCAQVRFSSVGDSNFSTALYPKYHKTGGPGDGPYVEMSQNGKSRFYIVDPADWKGGTLSARHVLMVFGSQNGGGEALIGETHGHFLRTAGNANALVRSDSAFEYVAATNGVTGIDPRASKPTGGWQILSLAVKDAESEIVSLGGKTNATDGSGNGGQNYAEVILFREAPSEAELAAAEAYLSGKWNLPVRRRGVQTPAGQVNLLGGTGTYAFDADAKLSGHFKGTLDISGRKVTLPGGNQPYRTADIPAEGRSLWIDPSLEGAIVFGGDEAKPLQVWGALPRDNEGLADTNKATSICLLGVSDPKGANRRPWFSDGPRVPGGASGWLDYSSKYSDGMAKLLIMAPTPINPATVKLEGGQGFTELTNVRDVFLVLDSSMGGGSTYLSQANGNNGSLRKRGTRPETGAPIWSDGCGDEVRRGETRLDGVVVDPDGGFTGRPEVLSLHAAGNVTAKALGHYEQDRSHYEIFAETLLYTTPLSEEQRRGIESYLMLKWLDKVPEGCSDFRGATVTGAGTLVAPAPRYLPQVGAGFEGTVELDAFDATFVLNGGTSAENAVSFGVHAPRLADAVVDVKVMKRHAGAYLLASGVAEGSTVTLGRVEGVAPDRVHVRVVGTDVYADVDSVGMLMIVR